MTYGALDKPIDIREAREWRGKVGGPQAAKIRNRHVKKDGHGKKTKLKSKQKLKLPEGHPDESVEDEDEDADDYGFTFDSSINKDMRSTFSFVHQLHKEGVEAAQKLKPGRAGQTIDGNGLSKYPNTQLRLGEDIQQVRDLTKSGGWDLNRIINEVEYQLKAVQFFRYGISFRNGILNHHPFFQLRGAFNSVFSIQLGGAIKKVWYSQKVGGNTLQLKNYGIPPNIEIKSYGIPPIP